MVVCIEYIIHMTVFANHCFVKKIYLFNIIYKYIDTSQKRDNMKCKHCFEFTINLKEKKTLVSSYTLKFSFIYSFGILVV